MTALLELVDVTVTRQQGSATVTVVDHVDVRVEAGETVLLTGPSGCGKSTLLAVAAGLIPHSRDANLWGRVLLDGVDVTLLPPAQRAHCVAFLAQDPATSLCLTRTDDELAFGMENRCVAADQIDGRVQALASRLGIDHLLGRRTAQLSGGEQQRMALAAALAMEPRVLLLDEPLSMLDGETAALVAGVLAGVAAGGTAILMVEHRASELSRAGLDPDRVVALAPQVTPTALVRHRRAGAAGGTLVTFDELRRDPAAPVVQRHVALPVTPGRITALLGPNGSGKSTLLLATAGLLPHIASPQAARCSMVFQRPEKQFIATTVDAELAWGSDDHGSAARQMAHRLGLDLPADRSPWTLSMGQQRRLSIVAVAAQPHPVILLDEPTLGLDPTASRQVADLIDLLAQEGRAVIIATHDEALARCLADDVVRLPAGPPAGSGDDDPGTKLGIGRGDGALGRCSPLTVFALVMASSLGLLATTDIAVALLAWATVTALTPILTRTRLSRVLLHQLPAIPFALGVFVVNIASRPWPGGLQMGAGLAGRALCLAALAVLFVHASDPERFVAAAHQVARVPARMAWAVLAGARLLEALPTQWRDLQAAHLVRARGRLPGTSRLTRRQQLRLFGRSAFTLLVDALRQGQRLAEALETRALGMHGQGPGARTHRRGERLGAPDVLLALTWLVIAVAVVLLARTGRNG